MGIGTTIVMWQGRNPAGDGWQGGHTLGVHDKGAVLHDGLPNGLAGHQQKPAHHYHISIFPTGGGGGAPTTSNRSIAM